MSDQVLAGCIEHTVLAEDANKAAILEGCEVVQEHGCPALVVAPRWVALARKHLPPETDLVTVIGWPDGANPSRLKLNEAAEAVAAGATHLDVVVNGARVVLGAFPAVSGELRALRNACPNVTVKLIVESAARSEMELIQLVAATAIGGAQWLKTSTGRHPAGGATPEAVRLLHELGAPYGLRVKASGGIRSAEAALAMLEAGAERIGTSHTEAILSSVRALPRS